MGSQEFGQLVEAARLRKGWTRSKLAVATGILADGSVLDATQIRRTIDGTRKLDQDMVARIIRALELSESEAEEAWHLSGIWPPDLSLEDYRRFRQHASARGVHVLREYLEPAGHDADVVALRPIPGPGDLDEFRELINPDRRRHRRRTDPPVAPLLLRRAS